MNQPFVYQKGVFVALILALQAVLAPALTAAVLYGACLITGTTYDAEFLLLTVLVVLLCTAMLPPSGFTQQRLLTSARVSLSLRVLTRWGAMLGILFAIGYAVKSSAHYSRQVVFGWAIVTPMLIILGHLLIQELLRAFTMGADNSRRAIFAGCNDVSIALSHKLAAHPEAGLTCLGFFDDRGLDRLRIPQEQLGSVKLLGRLPELAEYVKSSRVDVIFIALPVRHVQRVKDLLDDLRDTTISIYYVPDIFLSDLIQARTGDLFGIPVVAMCETPFYGYRGVTKRLIDVIIASVALVALGPLMLLIALLVKLSSPGPILFRQRRYGLDGQQITVYKFRSMTVAEDGAVIPQARRNDARFTSVGNFLRRYSLDELPQFINVLQGRMSLVGPRPHAVAHNEEYRKLIKGYMVRHKVLPGITGLAQVNGCRGGTERLEDMRARVEYDLDYLRRWTPMLDLQILWRTMLMVFKDDKAY